MAIKSFFGSPESADKVTESELASFIDENSKIIGYYNEGSEAIQQIIKEAHEIEIIRLLLGIEQEDS